MNKYLLFFCLITTLVSSLSACVVFPVKPWERDLLAEKHMQLTPSPLETSLEEHTYFSKEAATGGRGVGGGGCGCN